MSTSESSTPKRGCGFGCLVTGFAILGFIVFLVFASIVGLGVIAYEDPAMRKMIAQHKATLEGDYGEDEFPNLEEVWSYGSGTTKVVRIPIEGMILLAEGGGGAWQSTSTALSLRSIRRATLDPDVKGIILEINSGGGGITDSDIIFHALKKFKEEDESRIIVAIMGDVAASGAYYIAVAADFIFAHPTTLTGSIGVIMQSYNIKQLAQKIGIQDVTIKSGDNKDFLNPFQDVKPEQREMLQKIIASMHQRFVNLVAENRRLARDVVAPLADGRVFLADEALKLKLIDGIGYSEDARDKLAELLKAEEGIRIYRYDEQLTFWDMLSRPGIGFSTSLRGLLRGDRAASGLHYQWTW